MNPLTAMVFWRPHLGALGSGLLMMLLAAGLVLTYRRLLKRHLPARALLLLAPKGIILLLLVIALLDPLWGVETAAGRKARLTAVVDVSGSMSTPDRDHASRAERSRRILSDMQRSLSKRFEFELLEFDTAVRKLAAPAMATNAVLRGTDIGACLLELSERSNRPGSDGIVLLTDGGDEPVQPARLPQVPLYIVGVGADASSWNDLRIAGVEAPQTVEQDSDFEVVIDIRLDGGTEFVQSARSVPLVLEEQIGEARAQLASASLELAGTRLQRRFTLHSGPTAGIRRFCIDLGTVQGEISPLNNRHEFAVTVRRKSINVFLFSNVLSWDIATLRQVLDADKGVNLTAVTRITGDRHILQGDPGTTEADMEAGFPSQAAVLSRYQCIILGSFRMTDFTAGQRQALLTYVDQGGCLVVLGGEQSFSDAGMPDDGGSLTVLLPWTVSAGSMPLMTGPFPLSPASAALDNPMVSSTMQALAGARRPEILALNVVGRLKPGAAALFGASFEGSSLPVIAMQAYGNGIVLGIASNTLWLWHRGEESLRRAYEVFWNRLVRYLGGIDESGRFLSVRWDRSAYRPGEEALVTLRVTGHHAPGELRIEGMTLADGIATKLSIDADSSAEAQASCRIEFPRRADYTVTFLAYTGQKLIERYERILPVAPRSGEGSSLELNESFLKRLAMRPSDRYASEKDIANLVEAIELQSSQSTAYRNATVIEAKGLYAALLLTVLLVEWLIRRRFNLF